MCIAVRVLLTYDHYDLLLLLVPTFCQVMLSAVSDAYTGFSNTKEVKCKHLSSSKQSSKGMCAAGSHTVSHHQPCNGNTNCGELSARGDGSSGDGSSNGDHHHGSGDVFGYIKTNVLIQPGMVWRMPAVQTYCNTLANETTFPRLLDRC